ncbi:MAG: hypothetical protein LBD59_00510 [Prevotellaceae bacterium]|jgi:hypothetical protein|nr:hypothetical protein [Prevotellaceae bacterium]
MENNEYQDPENVSNVLKDPEVAYKTKQSSESESDTVYPTKTSSEWDPNVPFHGTQEEWWYHFHEIEQGEFYPVEEVHQSIREWLKNKKK